MWWTNWINYRLPTEPLCFYFVLFCTSPRSFPRLNHLRKVRQRFPRSILFFSDQKVASCSGFSLSNASVNSSSAHPPPRANPRALAFFLFFEEMGKCPGLGTKKEGKCPAPEIVAFQHFCSFFIKAVNLYCSETYFKAIKQRKSQEAFIIIL